MAALSSVPQDERQQDHELVVSLAAQARASHEAPTDWTWPSVPGASALPVAASDELLAQVAEHFAIDGSWSVIARFVSRERDLLPVLLDLPQAAREAFGLRTTVTLERFVDRDSSGGEQLVAVIDTALPRAERRRRLREFDRSWWLARKRVTGSRVFLDSR